jgi:hypothetical protein
MRISTGAPLPLPRLLSHSLMAEARREGSMVRPASSVPSPVGRVSSNSPEPVKLRMQNASSQSRGTGWRWPVITATAVSLRAYTMASIDEKKSENATD